MRRAAATVGKPVAQTAAHAVILTEYLDPAILAQEGQQLVEHRPGQRQAFHQPGGIQAAGVVQVFAEQIDQQRFGKSGFRHAAWLCNIKVIVFTGTIQPGLLDPGNPRQVHGLLPGICWFLYIIRSASSTDSARFQLQWRWHRENDDEPHRYALQEYGFAKQPSPNNAQQI
ncbi:hypothetical protein D3C78_864880 [compost metagenome]